MEWVPIVLGTFKLLALGIGVFYAIKSHRDGEKREREEELERERELEREKEREGESERA